MLSKASKPGREDESRRRARRARGGDGRERASRSVIWAAGAGAARGAPQGRRAACAWLFRPPFFRPKIAGGGLRAGPRRGQRLRAPRL